MSRDEALTILRAHAEDLRSSFGVSSLSLFGSTVRDEAGPESDVDVLVEFEKTTDLFEFVRLQMHLEAIFGRKVDLVMPDALKHQLRDGILGEAIRAA